MRFILYVLLLWGTAIASCRSPNSGAHDPNPGDHDAGSGAHGPTSASLHIPDSLAQKTMNTYIGQLGDGLITVVLNYISGDVASGYAIQRGRRCNLNGSALLQGASIQVQLEDSGDHPEKFEIVLDTLDWKMTGRALVGGEWRQLKAALRPEPVHFENLWVADMYNYHDSILTLEDNGVCVFRFYQRPRDSTSQLITIKGNYERLAGTGKGFRVEWEDNAHLLPLNAELKEEKDELRGCGLKLAHFLAPW
jgi:hypothetical protein